MKKKIWPFILCAAILLAGVLGCIWVMHRPSSSMVEIVQNDIVLYCLDLSQAEDQILEIAYEGRTNQIEIKDHQIHMLEAECPDKTCVHMGWLDSGLPIVCLPNHLVIQFREEGEIADAILY